MPLPFNKNLDLKLLKLVKDNPVLYNGKHPKYMDFDSREVVWQKIGDALNRPALVCKSRWVNIRDMMRRRVRERLQNPNQRSYNYKYEDQLTFMLPYFKETTIEPNEEFDNEEITDSNVEMPTEVYVDDSIEYEKDSRDVKPTLSNLRNAKRTEEYESVQELNPTDPLDVFLITIGATLRKFSAYYLNQAKSKIFQVVQDYELEQIVHSEGQPGSSTGNR